MNMPETKQQKIFSTKFLIILLAISILTNIILIIKVRNVDVLESIQIALLTAPTVLPADHVRGNPNAKYTVIEYADFQCGYCSQLNENLITLMKESNVRWVFRHFPLTSHPLAEKAAEASECAGEQGKFWEYSDALYALKERMTEDTFGKLAQKLGLNWVSFGLCMSSNKYAPVVSAQHEDGMKLKIAGTPMFYLNGKRFNGAVPLEDLRKLTGVK
jgi:protein-disulfide isomerase